MAVTIEEHYERPMDIEWGKDGNTGKLYILQARPETVQSRSGKTIQRFTLKDRSVVLSKGRSIGQKIGTGAAKIIRDVSEMNRVQNGDVLVSDMTDPDWEPVMKRASAIVTNRGGRTCHAAIMPARTRNPGGRWLRQRDGDDQGRRFRDRQLCRRRRGLSSTKACWNSRRRVSSSTRCRIFRSRS